MKQRMCLTALVALVTFFVAPVVADEVTVSGVFGLDPVPEGTAMAVWVPLESDESIAGVSWYNNDGTLPFPELLAVAGSSQYPSVLEEAVVVGEQVSGATLGWSTYSFDTPLASATPGLFVIFRLPPGAAFVDEGHGAGLGYREGDGQIRSWLTSTAGEWDLLSPEYQMAVTPVMNTDKDGEVLVLGAPDEESEGDSQGEIAPATLVAGMTVAPNPFNPQTEIKFTLPNASEVKLTVFDVRGRRISTLVSGALDAGVHTVNWDGRDNSDRGQASGVYLVLLEAGSERLTRRLTMVQ